MDQNDRQLRGLTRRQLFGQCAMGLGGLALASLLDNKLLAAPGPGHVARPGSVALTSTRGRHFPARAKNVIYLFMAGGPSQLELFDYKPQLNAMNGKPIPDSFIEGKRFAFMDSSFKDRITLLGSKRAFKQHGHSGAWVSELYPHTSTIVDDISIIKSCATDVFNHAPAKLFMNTGTTLPGRPSMGSWVTYGIGSDSRDLPGFVVLQSGPRGPRGGAVNWGSGFLPTSFQGVPFQTRTGGDPIVNLSSPQGINPRRQRDTLDAVRDLNLQRLVATGDPEIASRIAQYEMAYRMQSSAPELIDLSGESQSTLDLYGAKPGEASFANNCLLARRLVERGVRFVQLYHTNWDSHGGPGENLQTDFEKLCRQTDQAQAALIK